MINNLDFPMLSFSRAKKPGFISLFLNFIFAVVLIVAGFYAWEKYQRFRFPEKSANKEIKGPIYYFFKIKEKGLAIIGQKKSGQERFKEIFGSARSVTDSSGSFFLDIPGSWVEDKFVPENSADSAKSKILSATSWRSGDFSWREKSGKRFYEEGCRLTMLVYSKAERKIEEESGKREKISSGQGKTSVGEYTFSVFKDPDSENGQVIEGYLITDSRTFQLKMLYNPQNFVNAEFIFREIFESLRLKS